jgi:hypothetical protein
MSEYDPPFNFGAIYIALGFLVALLTLWKYDISCALHHTCQNETTINKRGESVGIRRSPLLSNNP